ncbi:MAG: cytochrome oxidase subunit III [Armatimonadetes bacterium JP3_11]|jgi:cytochrome c oxidase subunit 3|nr:MAG: cytochrome oxidase subunit III [Armatimonadetes bacterium CP1_7O]OYT74224.1 MAG: cytochrome oxidase subunit III [Armatimonadetes bacterium JP3_11]RMH09980.1 MAG: cytochrome oxidase subunit III [Armatimonadota bacterium]
MAKLKSRPQMYGRGAGEGNLPPHYRGDEGGDDEAPFDRFQTARLGLYIFLGALTTMFGALAVLYLLRVPASQDFAFRLPKLSWFSTAIILLSSIPCQMALNAARAGSLCGVWRGMTLTLMLGALFLALQLGSWDEIARQLQGAPVHFFSAMFYVISAAHGLHLLGGLLFVGYLLYQVQVQRALNPHFVELGATYWHFLGVLWAVLFGVMLIK